MRKIINDGRKLALDQRLVNDMLPDNENSKAGTCVEKVYEIWEQTKEQKVGARTNVQDRLIALHHLDVPWRPSDIEQQEGL